MSEKQKVIFDMDGTLYKFKGPENTTFVQSQFYADLKVQIVDYIAARLNVSKQEAQQYMETVGQDYDGELSLGFEKEYAIDRYDYYEGTWGAMTPAEYIVSNPDLKSMMDEFAGRSVLLTAAPKVWAQKVIEYLNLGNVFEDRFITGEPDIRKPNPEVFKQAAQLLGVDPEEVISVGDQNYSDIVPAASLGMKTILIGPEQQSADYRVDSVIGALAILKAWQQ
ncbi:MAG: HAD family hydrolase [Candidatus Microsaccharimonas sp.]